MEKVIVAGIKSFEGKIFLICKDKVNKDPRFKASASKNGTLWLSDGYTMEEAKKEFPLGQPVDGVWWGAQIPATKEGEELKNVYKIEWD